MAIFLSMREVCSHKLGLIAGSAAMLSFQKNAARLVTVRKALVISNYFLVDVTILNITKSSTLHCSVQFAVRMLLQVRLCAEVALLLQGLNIRQR